MKNKVMVTIDVFGIDFVCGEIKVNIRVAKGTSSDEVVQIITNISNALKNVVAWFSLPSGVYDFSSSVSGG